MTDCILCDIVTGKLPSSRVLQDEICTVFMHIQPINPGHMLVVPNIHAAYLSELNEDSVAHMFRIAHRLMRALHCSDVNCEGINFYLAEGEAAMKDSFHVHLHVFPRLVGDGFSLSLGPTYFEQPGQKELDDTAQNVRAAYLSKSIEEPSKEN